MTVTRAPTGQDLKCLVCHKQAQDIDHVVNRGMGGSKKRDVPENKVPLCRECHELKTLGRIETWVRFGESSGWTYCWQKADSDTTIRVPVEVSQRYKCLVLSAAAEPERSRAQAGSEDDGTMEATFESSVPPVSTKGSAAAPSTGSLEEESDGEPNGEKANVSALSDAPKDNDILAEDGDRDLPRVLPEARRGVSDEHPRGKRQRAADDQHAESPSNSSQPLTHEQRVAIAKEDWMGRFSETGWEPPKQALSDEQIMAVIGEFRREVKQRQWRHGDFANYLVEARGEEAWQFLDSLGYDHHGITRVMTVCQVFPASRRREKLSFSHHDALYTQDVETQDAWLDRAEVETWDRSELRAEFNKANTPPPVAPPTGQFATIVIDPPWPYGTRYDPDTRRAGSPYPEMSLEEITALAIPTGDDCALWLWTTNAFMHEAYHILEEWGFTPKTILTWAKDRMGLGDWLRGQTEHCILATKGKPRVDLTNQTTLLHGPMREHSRKPDEFYALVEALCPEPRLEMFARQERDGWTVHGNETDKF